MPARLLFIYAHPDDESFGVAGIARMYADQGADIALVTATRGDAGRAGEPPICSREELPARREAELREAARDSRHRPRDACSTISTSTSRRRLPTRFAASSSQSIRRHRPQIVVTFDPDGANLHPDHVAISRFAIDAVTAAGDPRWYPDAGEAHRRAAPAVDIAGDAVGRAEVGRPGEGAGRGFPDRHLRNTARPKLRRCARIARSMCRSTATSSTCRTSTEFSASKHSGSVSARRFRRGRPTDLFESMPSPYRLLISSMLKKLGSPGVGP